MTARDPDAPNSGFQPGVEAGDTATTDQSAISPAFVSRVVGAIGDGDKPYLWRTVKELHPADLADLLEHLPPDAFRKGIHLLGKDLPAEAVAELSDTARADALHELTDAAISAMIGHLDSDDASFLLGDLEEDRRARILNKVSATDRAAIESSLAFDEESAGRLMQRDFVAGRVLDGRTGDRPHAQCGRGRPAGDVLRDLHRRSGLSPAGFGAGVTPAALQPRQAPERHHAGSDDPRPPGDGPGGSRLHLPAVQPCLRTGGGRGRR